jgi:hypothetical protein
VPFVWPEHEQPYDYWRFTQWGVDSICIKHGFITREKEKSSTTYETVLSLFLYWYKNMCTTGYGHIDIVMKILFYLPIQALVNLLSLLPSWNNDLPLDNIFVIQKQ